MPDTNMFATPEPIAAPVAAPVANTVAVNPLKPAIADVAKAIRRGKSITFMGDVPQDIALLGLVKAVIPNKFYKTPGAPDNAPKVLRGVLLDMQVAPSGEEFNTWMYLDDYYLALQTAVGNGVVENQDGTYDVDPTRLRFTIKNKTLIGL